MLFLEGECPHCNEKRGFHIFAMSEYGANTSFKEIKDRDQKVRLHGGTSVSFPKSIPASFFGAGTCAMCWKPILLELEISEVAYLLMLQEHIVQHDKRYIGPLPTIKGIWPQPEPPYSHPSLPEKVRALFIDLQTMLKQSLAPSLIITGCRSVLEEAARELSKENEENKATVEVGKTSKKQVWLKRRIADLKEKAIVNGVLHDWAMNIKEFGDNAAHELKGTPEEAAELVEFTKLFLQYTFEFRARVEEARKGKEHPPKEQEGTTGEPPASGTTGIFSGPPPKLM
jgi:hypothetical protein